jgi:eukaryotic-like serine/threonine-protein kinase
MIAPPGFQVGPYTVLGPAGRGGMADVFVASDSRTGRRVALKLVPIGDDEEARQIVEAEREGAEYQKQLWQVYRQVPEVYEYAADDSYLYIAMEFLDGQNLSELIKSGPLPAPRAVGIAIQICRFLEAAHTLEPTIDGRKRRSLLHGDLKPRNIRILPNDEVKVFDFGAAKALSFSRKVTRHDFGSIAYLSPERIESGDIDAHADFWGVGVILYEMVSGEQPFQAHDTRRLESRIRSRRAPVALDHGCPAGLQAVVAKLLAGAQLERYGSAQTIRDDLESVLGGRETSAEREGWLSRGDDEPPTRRIRGNANGHDTEEATRRTLRDGGVFRPELRLGRDADGAVRVPEVLGPDDGNPAFGHDAAVRRPELQLGRDAAVRRPELQLGRDPTAVAPNVETTPTPANAQKPRSRFRRVARAVLLFVAFAMVANEFSVSSRANRLAANVATLELGDLDPTWQRYQELRSGSMGIGVSGFQRALLRQTLTVTNRVIDNYRTPSPSVREAQWRAARNALAHALTAGGDDPRLRAALRYCEGHLHRIDGEARKARKLPADAQREFADALVAFREAAQLRPDWADPYLGLMRTFIYGLDDVERGEDALAQAVSRGYKSGDRETLQLAEGHRARAEALVRSARELSGLTQELQSLKRAADEYHKALDLYAQVPAFGDAARQMRATQRGLAATERRIAALTDEAASEPPATWPDSGR